MATYLRQSFRGRRAEGFDEIRERVVRAGLRRSRACLMTTVTTIIALAPILVSTGRGSDVAQPMAIPVVGGMIVELISLFIVPTVFCWVQETRWRLSRGGATPPPAST